MLQGKGTLLQTATPTPTANGSNSALPGVNQEASEPANELVNLFMQLGVPGWISKLIVAVLVLVIAWYVSKIIKKLLGQRIAQRIQRPAISRLLSGAIQVTVIAIGLFYVLADVYQIIETWHIALSVSVLAAVVGVMVTPLVTDFVTGLFVLGNEPYEVGDMIELIGVGQHGYVKKITFSYTKIVTFHKTSVLVPNRTIRERNVINYTDDDHRIRLWLDIGVTYESDIDEARELIEDAARTVDAVVTDESNIRIGSTDYPGPPVCYINEFGGSSVVLRLRYWLHEPYRLLTTRSAIQTAIWDHLKDSDVEIAYPHMQLMFDETSGQLPISIDETPRNGEQT